MAVNDLTASLPTLLVSAINQAVEAGVPAEVLTELRDVLAKLEGAIAAEAAPAPAVESEPEVTEPAQEYRE